MPKLFDIGADLMALSDLLDESNGEITPENEPILEAFFAELENDQAVKLEGYVGLIKTLEGEAAVAKATAEQFQMKARSRENSVKRLKDRVKMYLEVTNQPKAVTEKGFTLAVRANGGKQPLDLDDLRIEDLPPEFRKITVTVDTEKIREHLEAGGSLSFARLQPRGNHLRIG